MLCTGAGILSALFQNSNHLTGSGVDVHMDVPGRDGGGGAGGKLSARGKCVTLGKGNVRGGHFGGVFTLQSQDNNYGWSEEYKW